MKFYLKLILYSIFAYLVLGCLLYLGQNYVIFQPISDELAPKKWGLESVEKITLTTKDKVNITAWYSQTNSNKPTLVYFHGNAGHLGYRTNIVKNYINKGYGVLILSYRGYGDSDGSPSEEGIYADARAALDYFKKSNTYSNIESNCMILYGVSLGSAVAVQMATEYDFAALVLVSPITKALDIARYHYGIYPVSWFLTAKLDSLAKINNLKNPKAPLLFIHGDGDEIIPLKFGMELYNKFSGTKEIKVLKDYGHNNMPDLTSVLDNFLEKHDVCNNKLQY